MTGYLLDIGNLTAVGSLIGEGIAQGCADGVRGKVLHMGGEVQELAFIDQIGMHGGYCKLAMGEGARLVEDDGMNLCQHIHIVGPLHKDSLTRGTADAAEERQRHADDEGAGTRNHQEHQGSIEPRSKTAAQERRDDGEGKGEKHHDGGVDAGKAGDEGLALRLMLAGVLHQTDNLRNGALAESLRGAYLDDARDIDAAGDDLIAGGYIAGQGLARQGNGVQGAGAFDDQAIERHFLTRADDDGLAYPHRIGTDSQQLTIALHIGHVGADVHQVGNALAALAFGIALKEFANLEEQHHEDGLGELGLCPREEADAEGTDGGNRHQEVLIEGIAVGDSLSSLFQRVVAYY